MASIKLKGDTSGEVTISAPSVAGTTTLELPATSSTLATQNSLGVRNLIINGDMQIAQRGTSATGITSSNYYTVDRFKVATSLAGTWTMTQDTDVPTGQGFSSSSKLDCTTANASLSAGSNLIFFQSIESQNLQHLKFGTSSAESLTLSFWVKSNKTGTYTAELYLQDDARQISNAFTINTADTWEKKTITVDGDTVGIIDNDNGAGISLFIWLVSGSNWTSGTFNTSWASAVTANRVSSSNVNLADSTSNYINITGVQLEVGTEATPFEHRPYDMELARCQRYYEDNSNGVNTMWSGYCTNGNTYYLGVHYKVTKRSSPTVTFSHVGSSSFPTTGAVNNVNTFGFVQYRTANGTNTQGYFQSSFTANAEL